MNELFTEEKITEEKLDKTKIKEALNHVLMAMKQRGHNIRKKGKGDLKYEILYRVITMLEENEFEDIYSQLKDFEKHAIVTRLENASREGYLPYNFVEKFRRELYGVNKDGEVSINFQKQVELEKFLQNQND